MLAETPIASSFALPSAPLVLVRTETEQPVDDLLLLTATGGIILAQVKRSIDASTTPRSQLAAALSQVVRQVIRSRSAQEIAPAGRPWERRLDPGRDRLAIITRSLSAKLAAANRLLHQLRGAPRAAFDSLGTPGEERSAMGLLQEHIARIWQEEAGAAVGDDDMRACLLPLVFVALEVETAERDEAAAKSALQHALRDAGQIDACWSELGALAGTLIPRRGGADRASVQNHLETRGITIGIAASYRTDVEKLRAYGLRAAQNLAGFAALHVREQDIRIPRAVVDELADAISKTTSLLVTGDPGAGKSGAVHDLAERLAANGHDVVVLAVDRIVAESMGQLRVELGLEHELVDVLANWPGDRPAYLLIDALDAARARETARLVRDLLRQLIESRTRWHVVASIREFDLENSPQLQALFAGVPPGRHAARAFARLRHVHVQPLTDEELQYLWAHAPEFAVVFEQSDDRTRDLLRIPFHLRLFANLFSAGVAADELTSIRTRSELLEGYWKWRVRGEADPDADACEEVLRIIASAMIAHRSLLAVRSELPGTVDSGALTRLHSNGVLTPWTAPGATEPERAVITFSHHVLFDYAAARLLLRGTPETLVSRLADDPEFILSFRPSAVMHFEYLWLRETSREAFWPSAIAVSAAESLPAIAKTVAPAVAVSAAQSLADFDGLLRLLPAPPAGVEQTARHVFGALLTAEDAVQPLVGTSTGLWAALLRVTAAHLTGVTAYAIRPTLYEATERIDSASEAERKDLWSAAAALLRFARSQPTFDVSLAVQGVRSLCRTYAVDLAATRELLHSILDRDYFEQNGVEELYWIAREIKRVISIDPEFVRRVYDVAFSYRVLDDRQVSLGGGALLNITTSIKQHHESILHSLGESFAEFLQGAPETAIQTLPRLLETRLETRSSSWVNDDVEHFSFLGSEVEIREDGSYIWDGRSSVGDDDYGPILHALEDYFAKLRPDAAGVALLKLFGATNVAAAGWRQLLRAAAKTPERLGRVVIDLAVAEPLLYAHDTTTEAGRLIAAIYPLVSHAEQERIERAILHGAADGGGGRIREHFRDRLLGSIPVRVPVTAEARSRIAALADTGGAPANNELFEITGGAADYTDEDHLASLRVPVKSAETQQLLALKREIEKFTRESLNSVPDQAAIDAILPRLHDLDAALHTSSLHEEARDYGWGHLAEAAERIARIPSFDAAPFADWIVETLGEGTHQQQPRPEADSAFKRPAWGSPAARLDAAEGWMRIGRYPRFVDAAYLEIVRALANDGAPSVRFHVARDLRGLYRTAPDLLWELMGHFAENENSLGVLQGFLETVQVLTPHHPDRTVPLLLRVLERVPDGKDEREVRDAAFHAIAGLYLWQGNGTCEKVVREVTTDLPHRTHDASRIAGSCEYALEGDPEAPPNAVAEARRRATATLSEMLTAAHAAMEAGGLDEHLLRDVASFATHIGLAVYRIMGVDREGVSRATDLSDRYALVEPLLPRLATFGVPMLAHYLLGVLETLVPLDPLAMFQLVGQVVESARRYGYEYESEAVRLIVRVLKRYMAEYPEVVRSAEGQKIFLRTLDIFVQVGWPDARRLSYHLEEAFR
jgi:hypothetical protein